MKIRHFAKRDKRFRGLGMKPPRPALLRPDPPAALPLRVSVRGLVAFSYFPEDIVPVSKSLMEMGMRGHLARQGQSDAQAEKRLSWTGEAEGRPVTVTGRMDLYDPEQSPPLIEEIKLCLGDAPMEPLPEHLYQAVGYGYLLAARDGLAEVSLQVSYVRPTGELVAAFRQNWRLERLQRAFRGLLLPWARWQKTLEDHRLARDSSIAGLDFPYPHWRPGQRQMSAQVYTAIRRKKRLYAAMPTGTGKSAAVLFPALKALGQGLCRQIFCLTARGTQRLSMQAELGRMAGQGLVIHAVTLTAKEKTCPQEQARCHPEHCGRARGHFARQAGALREAMAYSGEWDLAYIESLADHHLLCPFELSLALCELADVVIGDYNYALDPQVRLSRVFDQPRGITLLIDEAHNLPDRVRSMLSGQVDTRALRELRREAGRAWGRKGGFYMACTRLLRLLEQETFDREQLVPLAGDVICGLEEAWLAGGSALVRDLIAFLSAWQRAGESGQDYAIRHTPGKGKGHLQVINLNPAPHLEQATRRMTGCVFYSATLSPLSAMRTLLGGGEEDACLALPSPFPKECLLSLQLSVNTRYQARADSLNQVAEAILALFESRPGKHIAYFPSFAYLSQAREALLRMDPELPLLAQAPRMEEQERADFLSAFTRDDLPALGLCVLGGVFSEGVDLPGRALIGCCVVGVGLPQVNEEQNLYKDRMQEVFSDGFGFAYRYPGMHKVVQAAGRLIRSETDRGILLLLDDRYSQNAYRSLLPSHLSFLRVQSVEDVRV